MSQAQHKTFRIYGCGGTGINITRQHQSDLGDAVLPAYFDTSRSNLADNNIEYSYLIDGIEGSGKQRDLNVEAMRRHVVPAVNKFPPGDFNVVIFSGSGGSGSVFGPLVVNELLGRNKAVVAIVLGDQDSGKATENTHKTLQTLSALSANHSVPVVMVYREMANGSGRRETDEAFHQAIGALRKLARLTGVPASELDAQDVFNWLHYHKVSSHKPGLSLLNIYSSNDRLAEQFEALSVASIYGSPDDAHGEVKAAYRTTGYSNNDTPNPLHFVISQNGLTATVDSLKRKTDEIQQQASHLAGQHVTLHDVNRRDDFLIV